MFDERLEFEYKALMGFYKARLGRWLDCNHCVYTVNFLSCFWVAFLRITHRSSVSAGGADGALAVPLSLEWHLDRPELRIQRDEVAQPEFSNATWLAGCAATVDNSAVPAMPVSFSFFLFLSCQDTTLPLPYLHAGEKPRETKFENQLVCKAYAWERALIQRVFYTDGQIWKQHMWKAKKFTLLPLPKTLKTGKSSKIL